MELLLIFLSSVAIATGTKLMIHSFDSYEFGAGTLIAAFLIAWVGVCGFLVGVIAFFGLF